MKQDSPEMVDLKKRIENDLKKSSISRDNDYSGKSNYSDKKESKKNGKGLFRMFD